MHSRNERTFKSAALSLGQQALSSFVQSLDQTIGTARRDDGRKLVTTRREIADGPVEVDIDDPSAADQIVYPDDPSAGLHEPGLDDFAAATRRRNGLRIDNEAFAGIIVDLARIVGNDESFEGLLNGLLLCRREALPGRTDREPRHGREVESAADGRRKAFVALAH